MGGGYLGVLRADHVAGDSAAGVVEVLGHLVEESLAFSSSP